MKVTLDLNDSTVVYWATARRHKLSGNATLGQRLREQVIDACRDALDGDVPVVDWWAVTYFDDDAKRCELLLPSHVEAAEAARELMHEGVQDVQLKRHIRGNRG